MLTAALERAQTIRKHEATDLSTHKSFHQWRPHPWHGLPTGPNEPEIVNVYVEITPFDVIKYEIDKASGYLCVDRPQRGSASPPSLYGFIPQTLCGPRVGALCEGAPRGDGDPMDVCVVSERPIGRADVLVRARVVGGLKMIDDDEADDKIIAVLQDDLFWHDARDIGDLPPVLIERFEHYFSTYKMVPGATSPMVLKEVYGREHAFEVVRASIADYSEAYGT